MATEQSQTQKFLGCVLSIKTKASEHSAQIRHILGTVRAINIDSQEQCIVLDDAMVNGEMYNDGYVVLSQDIADLQVIGKPQPDEEEVQVEVSSGPNQNLQSQGNHNSNNFNLNFVKNDLNYSAGSSRSASSGQDSDDEAEPPRVNVLLHSLPAGGGGGTKASSAAGVSSYYPAPQYSHHKKPVGHHHRSQPNQQGKGQEQDGYRIAKPKPRLPAQQQQRPQHTSGGSMMKNNFANLQLQDDNSEKENILLRTFGGMQKVMGPPQPKPSEPLMMMMPGQQKPKPKMMNKRLDEETFGLEVGESMSEEFDFEKNNAQFAKLPAPQKPKQMPKGVIGAQPKFSSQDTTHRSERIVDSTVVKSSTRRFLTDTGIAIPAVELATRSRILNLANNTGLSHERMIESMARAVTQVALPTLGDACRLSPERSDAERPWVLFLCGPHWQGAVGIATARLLSTLGVHTFVHSPKEELTVCASEEKLYKLSGELFGRKFSDIPSRPYDLVVVAMDDHLSRTLATQTSYVKFMQSKSTTLLYIDPPVAPDSVSYMLDKEKKQKVFVVCPLLPLHYTLETGVKYYVVNLGIPTAVYLRESVVYKSFYGDKLAVQLFAHKG